MSNTISIMNYQMLAFYLTLIIYIIQLLRNQSICNEDPVKREMGEEIPIEHDSVQDVNLDSWNT